MKKFAMFSLILACLALPLTAQAAYKVSYQPGTEMFLPLIKAVYAEMGIAVSLEILPSERSLQEANSGTYDAELGRVGGMLAGYPNLMYTSEPIMVIDLIAMAKKGSAVTISSAADLNKYKIGIIRGSKLPESFVAAKGLTAESVPDPASLLKMLEAGRLDIALIPSNILASFASVAQVGPKLMSVPSYHILNKKHAALAPKFDAILKAMKADGRFAKLLSGK